MTWKVRQQLGLASLGIWVGWCVPVAGVLAQEDGADFSQQAIDEARQELAALILKEQISPDTAPFLEFDEPATETVNPLTSVAKSSEPVRPPALEDQAWLRDLTLPDLPVRWEEQLVSLLEYYRTDSKGQAVVAALLQRSGAYENMVREKLSAAGLPMDLLYVAMVESGFDLQARSGAGAVGMWQFVSSTATDYGLTVDRWADQRLSPEHATDAAVRFLASLHGRLKSWPLVLAAYNMGYSAVVHSIQKYNSNNFWMLASLEAGLPYETVNYVSKVTAYAIIARNPEAFGLHIDKPSERDVVLVDVPGGTSLSRIARAAGVSVDALIELNPELQRKRVPPDVEHWQVHLSQEAAERFRSKWPQQKPQVASHASHVLRLGERLTDVAERYETTKARLLALNGLESASDLRPGAKLRVPDVEPVAVERTERPVVGVPKGDFRPPHHNQCFYRVIEGDRLEEIARFFHVEIEDLMRWNPIDADASLADGMFLQVFVPKNQDMSTVIAWSPEEVQALVVGTERFFDTHEELRNRKRIRYRVKEGDSLSELSKRFGLSVGSIARINRFSRYDTPKPDSEIVLYVDNEAKN